LIAASTTADYASITASLSINKADKVDVTAGVPADLTITNLSGDLACKLYLVAASDNALSPGIDFTLQRGTDISNRPVSELKVFAQQKQIIVEHNASFNGAFVYDMLGKQHRYQDVSSQRFTIDASDLSDGIYMLRMIGDGAPVTTKFLLSR